MKKMSSFEGVFAVKIIFWQGLDNFITFIYNVCVCAKIHIYTSQALRLGEF